MANTLYEAGLSGELTQTSKAVKQAKEISLSLRPLVPLVSDTPFAKNPKINLQLTNKELEDNAQFLLTSGHESTALTITWALFLLAHYQDEQELIANEIKNILGNKELTLDILHKLPRLNNLFNETMRLYPSAILVNRETIQDVTVGELSIKKGTQIAVCFYSMHRHKNYWKEPDSFNPDRFNTLNKEQLRAFMPFSTGHHSCLGGKLAWLEAMTILTTILKDVKILSCKNSIKPIARYTLRPDGPVMLEVQKRN
ncbi:cytochrome P450 [Malaciobacter mytili]